MRPLIFATALVLSVCVGACSKPSKPSQERSREARAKVTAHAMLDEDNKTVAERESAGDKALTTAEKALVVAKVGDFQITLGDIEAQLAAQPSFARARYRTFDKKVEFLNNVVQFELLAMEAHKKGYDKHPDVVSATKRAMIQKFTQNDLQQLVTVSAITDADLQQFYDNNKSMFVKPEQIRASHCLLKTEEEAKKTLEDMTATIAADKPRARTAFTDITRRVSKDQTTAHMNGDLGFFSKDGYLEKEQVSTIRLEPELVAAAFLIREVNGLSPLVKTARGWHIVQLTNRRPGVNRTLDDARRQITNILLRQKKDSARTDYIKGLRTNANVQIFDLHLKALDVDSIQAVIPGHAPPPSPQAPPRLAPTIKNSKKLPALIKSGRELQNPKTFQAIKPNKQSIPPEVDPRAPGAKAAQ